MSKPVPCRCGAEPEINTSLLGYKFSFSCKCGGEEINFLVRSDSQNKALDNWQSLIKKGPFKHYVQKLPKPEASVVIPVQDPFLFRDPDPLRRYVRAHGGHCSGGGGAC